MTTEAINNVFRQHVLPIYGKLDRARLYAVNDDAKRHLVFLWRACKDTDSDNADELFKWACEQLADECGVKVLPPTAQPASSRTRRRMVDRRSRDRADCKIR